MCVAFLFAGILIGAGVYDNPNQKEGSAAGQAARRFDDAIYDNKENGAAAGPANGQVDAFDMSQ